MCSPGKKECITKNKIKKQKRYLTDSLKQLHNKFLTCSSFTISYSAFCKLRPFWVLAPTVTERNTCLCILHENQKLLVQSMHFSKLIRQSNMNEVISAVCCNNQNELCLLRKCELCSNKKNCYFPHDNKNIIYRKEWITEKEERISGKTKLPILVQRTTKKYISSTVSEIKNKFEKSLFTFMSHVVRMRHHYEISASLKKTLDVSSFFNTY